MSAQEHQQHTEKEGRKVAVRSQNELDGGKDTSRARDKEVQDRDLGWNQRSRRGGVVERGHRGGC